MNELTLPTTPQKLAQRLKALHSRRKNLARAPRRLRLKPEERLLVLEKTNGRCHYAAARSKSRGSQDHVLAHAAGGRHSIGNYLLAHKVCNGCKWFYSAEEFQWILKMGVWARRQMEDETSIGKRAPRIPPS